jgi:hypothetical protein
MMHFKFKNNRNNADFSSNRQLIYLHIAYVLLGAGHFSGIAKGVNGHSSKSTSNARIVLFLNKILYIPFRKHKLNIIQIFHVIVVNIQ